MHWGKSSRAAMSALVTVVATIALAGTGLVATAGIANAEGGLSESGTATYVVSDSGQPIQVTQKITLTNRKASTATTFYFWTGYSVWLPNGGSDLKVTSGGSTLKATIETDRGQQYADVVFPSRLRYGQSRTFTLTYTIPGSPPRSKGIGRVGKGFAAIEVFSPGDAGSATITIRAPRWMAVDSSEQASEDQQGDTKISTITGGGPDGLWSRLSLRDSSQTLKREVKVDDHLFNVVAFPGDTAWADHMAKTLPPTVRALEELTGQDWPSRTTNIYEDFSRLVYGWDGTYEGGNITISEAIDPALLAHELSHAWSTGSNLDGRWLTEGLAQELATHTMAMTKGKDQERKTVKPTANGAIPLLEWDGSAGDIATEVEDYAYPASWQTVHALVAGSTEKSRPELFRDLTSRRTIYDAGDKTLVTGIGWEQAFDLFEVRGGNPETSSIMQTWVLGSSKKSQLAARGPARSAYAAHEKLDGEWASPRGVREAMAEWNFAAAMTFMDQTKELAAAATRTQAAATKAGLDAKGARTAYEEADSTDEYTAVATRLADFTRQAGRYSAVQADVADANPLAALGGLVLRPSTQLDRAVQALDAGKPKAAERALSTAETMSRWSTAAGAGLLLLAGGLIAVLAFVVRHRRGRSAVVPEPILAAPVAAGPVADHPVD